MTQSIKSSSIPRSISFTLILVAVFILLVAITTVAFAESMPQAASDGEALFKEKCAACHTIGKGDAVGPDLKGVTERRSKEWLTNWILGPDKVLAAGDPVATELFQKYNQIAMPNLGLTPDQVASLIAYFEQGSGMPSGATTLPVGDAVVGKAYFTGDRRFSNGGPPCMACHTIAGIGSLGGGALGPDLSVNGFPKYGDVGLATFLNSPATVTMSAVWKNQPLTPEEQAALAAFLKEASVSGRPVQMLWQIAMLAIGGAVALIAFAQYYWGKRLKGVRRPMIERTLAASKK